MQFQWMHQLALPNSVIDARLRQLIDSTTRIVPGEAPAQLFKEQLVGFPFNKQGSARKHHLRALAREQGAVHSNALLVA